MSSSNIDYMTIDVDNLPLTQNKGYWQFKMPGHPLAEPKSGRVMLHRHLMSVNRGSWLQKAERVTFLDGNRENCDTHNLMIVSKAQLGQISGKATVKKRRVKVTCVYCGIPFTVKGLEIQQVYCSTKCKVAGFLRGDK